MSGTLCAVYCCKNGYRNRLPGISLHRFPKSTTMRKKWVQLCNRNYNFNSATGRVCSEHFLDEDFKRDLKNELLGLPLKKNLKEDAVPSQKLFKKEQKETKSSVDQDHQALKKMKAELVIVLLREELKDTSGNIQRPSIDEPGD